MSVNEKNAKNAEFFECKICDFKCSKMSNYKSHLSTRKHKNREISNGLAIFGNEKMPEQAEIIKARICDSCQKTYKDNSGLWRHKKKCQNFLNKNKTKNDAQNIDCSKFEVKDNEIISKLIQQNMDLVSQNQEFKQMMVEQNKTIIELANKTTIVNNNNTTNNNKFNLNIFLNEKCKDALNIMDFVSSLQLQLQDLEETGRLGYVQGISRIFINGLKQLDVCKRPIHCSDVKRETLYVKDNNTWEKEDTEKKKITRAIKHISIRNAKQVGEWAKENKGYNDSMSKKSDKYLKIISEANGGEPEEINKIIKTISSNVTIDKDKIL
jgi:hypothetical protein